LNKYNHNFPQDALRAYFTSNHDENSHSGSEYERMGNAAKAFAVCCALWNGIPLIYSGQELPNKNRLKFFDKDAIEWKDHCGLHDFYKTLLHLHSTHPALRAGDNSVSTYLLKTTKEGIFSFLRKNGSKEILVMLNLAGDTALFTITGEEFTGGTYKDVFSGDFSVIEKNITLSLEAWGYRVFEK